MKDRYIKFIYTSIYRIVMRKILAHQGRLQLNDDIELIYEKTITKFGNGAKVDAPKEHIGKQVYVVIRK